jgi:hypothetical protein
MGDLTTRDSHP